MDVCTNGVEVDGETGGVDQLVDKGGHAAEKGFAPLLVGADGRELLERDAKGKRVAGMRGGIFVADMYFRHGHLEWRQQSREKGGFGVMAYVHTVLLCALYHVCLRILPGDC